MSTLRILVCIVCSVCLCVHPSKAADPSLEHATEPAIHPTLLWFASQLVPSPQWSFVDHAGARFGLRWQATPMLFSFGINKKLSAWRWFIVEPYVRQSGSIELFWSPEYVNLHDVEYSQWAFRSGLRGYIPLWQHGEYLSASAATSYAVSGAARGISYEAGLYAFAGIAGVQVSYTPSFTRARWMLTLRVRYF